MKTVYLLRHAKSAWQDDQLDDHERPLNARGRKAAPEMGRWILDRGYRPDLILCSTAVRARETATLAFPSYFPERIACEKSLYLATAGTLLRRLREVDEVHASVLMVGHNPGLADLALTLARPEGPAAETARRRALAAKFPTAGFVGLKLPTDQWKAIAPQTGELCLFVSPREI